MVRQLTTEVTAFLQEHGFTGNDQADVMRKTISFANAWVADAKLRLREKWNSTVLKHKMKIRPF